MANHRIDLLGQRFGRLVAIRQALPDKNGRILWVFKCDCGNDVVVSGSKVKSGTKKSCGCLARETASNTQKAKRNARTESEYIENRISKDDVSGCWNWTGKKDKDGYGEYFFDNKKSRAHRSVYRYFVAEIPNGLVACHKCDNPSCVNPDHIFIGTTKDNAVDARDKGRAFVGEKNGRSKLTREIVGIIRSSDEDSAVLAERYGVSKHTISRAKNGGSWNV